MYLGQRQLVPHQIRLRIIQFDEQNGNRAAKTEFGVSESNVRLWRKSKENLEKMKLENCRKKAAFGTIQGPVITGANAS